MTSAPIALPARAPALPDPEAELAARLSRIWSAPPTLFGWLGTVDHKRIGVRYLVTAIGLLLVGGVEALLMRLQLVGPERRLLTPEAYNQVFTMHGLTMILWYASPVLSGFGNYLVPLLIGSRDMAFPRLNAFSYWMYLASGLLLYGSLLFGQAPDAGWFAYVPLASSRYDAGLNMDFYPAAILALTVSTTAGAVNFVVTIFKHRAPGMSLGRMPLFLYSTGTTAVLTILALPSLTAACVFLELDRRWGTHFFTPDAGGTPLLWQHLFWFFGHPWVYIVFIPATGMVSMLLPVFARRPIVGYRFVAAATVLTALVGLAVWVHHMFAVGMGRGAMSFFSAASMTISVFSTIQISCWVATLWSGRPVRTTSLLYALGFIGTFVIGGLSGVVTAVIPFDWQVHDTYFVVAHLHYVLIGANVFPVFAGLHYWWPKMTGRLFDERVGKLGFWLMFVGFNVGFFPMHLSGLLGMRRRVYTYGVDEGLGGLNLLTTLGSLVLAAGVAVALGNLIASWRRGAKAGPNPWGADTLEWSTPSPPPPYGFLRIPTVETRHPLWDTHAEDADPRRERELAHGRQTLTTTALTAEPEGITAGEPETLLPLALAVAVAATFAGLIAGSLVAGVVIALACAALSAAWLWPRSAS
ncbi:MAG TPA: cytochrome c oxidase subunit I [Polyangia bacterium]|nr:cytochrome c oxidase subunit I [Polyangia bacterium]